MTDQKYTTKTIERGFGRRPRGGVIEKPKEGGTALKRLFGYFQKERKFVVLLVISVLVSVIATVYAPALQSRAIDSITNGTWDLLPQLLLTMLVVYIIAGIATLIQGFLSAFLSQRVVSRLRAELFEKIVTLPLPYTDHHSHGDLMSRMVNDADNISSIISDSVSTLFSGILTLIGTVIMMFYYSVPLTLLTCSTIVFTLLLTRLITKKMSIYFLKRQELLGQVNGTVEEMITNSYTVTAFSMQEEVDETFRKTSDDLTQTGIKAEIMSSSMGPLMNMLNNVSFVIVAVFGAWFALKGYITVGVISAFIVYSKQFSRPINEIAQLYGQIETALAGAERIFEILDQPSEDRRGISLPAKVQGRITFDHVYFSYLPGQEVIHDFSLKVESGKKIALVGATGSGKTTMINLLMRFYEIDRGKILLDDQDIREVSLDSLRDHIGIVLQDTVLFSDTVRNNLTYANDHIDDEKLKRAAAISNADKVIRHLPNGYDTVLTSGGASLSQGQRQLLAIARAFLSDPDILILDEATSSVDTRTEQNIQDAMIELMKGRTSLIIAHRLSTIQDADEIIVMDHGRILETGTHNELLKKHGKYYDLYMKQFAGQTI